MLMDFEDYETENLNRGRGSKVSWLGCVAVKRDKVFLALRLPLAFPSTSLF